MGVFFSSCLHVHHMLIQGPQDRKGYSPTGVGVMETCEPIWMLGTKPPDSPQGASQAIFPLKLTFFLKFCFSINNAKYKVLCLKENIFKKNKAAMNTRLTSGMQ